MYTIGQFAVMTKLSAKTLRYYDEIDLLKPVRIDPLNSYRYYDDHCLTRAQEILIYRSCGISLKEIRGIMEHDQRDKSLVYILKDHLILLDQKLAEIQKSRRLLEDIIHSLEEENMGKIRIVETGDSWVLSIREMGDHGSIGSIISRLYETAAKLNTAPAGHHTIIRHEDGDFLSEKTDMEIFIPLIEKPQTECDILQKRKGRKFCETEYRGPVFRTGSAYGKIFNFLGEQGLETDGPFEETFQGPAGFISPGEMKIRIRVPVRKNR